MAGGHADTISGLKGAYQGMKSEHQQGFSEAELLRGWLSSRDVPCPVCGYSLRSIQSATCPECGARLDVRVGSTDLRIGLWLAGVISLSLAMGFVGLLTILFIVPFLAAGLGLSIGLPVVAISTIITVSYMLVLLRLIRNRKKFWSKPRKAQKASVVLYILASSAPVSIPLAIWFMAWLL